MRNRTRVGTTVWNLVGNRPWNQRGFGLIEAVVASTLFIVTVAGLAPLFVQSARSAADGRRAPIVLAAASAKLEQLLALAWTYDASGAPLSDLASDTSRDLPAPSGGTGLSVSPDDSLSRASPGFVDYIDAAGRSVGAIPASGAIFSRRWRISFVSSAPSDAVLIRVCIVRITAVGASGPEAEPPPEVCLGTLRVRR